MKKSIIGLILLLAGCITMAPLELRTYRNIIEFPGMKKDSIFVKSIQWLFANKETVGGGNLLTMQRGVYSDSGKTGIEYQNKEEGKIIGNINTPEYGSLNQNVVKSTIEIDIKDGKARITFIANSIFSPQYGSHPIAEMTMDETRQQYMKLLSSYKEYIMKSSSTKDKNW